MALSSCLVVDKGTDARTRTMWWTEGYNFPVLCKMTINWSDWSWARIEL